MSRYENLSYTRCGNSGLKLPPLALGGWNNFTDLHQTTTLCTAAFDRGITYIDLANNYGGQAVGAAETNVGTVLQRDLAAHRDELVIATKAGYGMWDGPYGVGSSKKYLFSSLHQSLKRLNLDYVDIFYSHKFDPDTPLTETADALALMVKQGKALYVGISNYNADQTREIADLLSERGVPLTIHQMKYSLLHRNIENGVLQACSEKGIGMSTFSSLEQGILAGRYLDGIPADSRAARAGTTLNERRLTDDLHAQVSAFNTIAKKHGMALSELALRWVLRHDVVATTIIGASRAEQIGANVNAVAKGALPDDVLSEIEDALCVGA